MAMRSNCVETACNVTCYLHRFSGSGDGSCRMLYSRPGSHDLATQFRPKRQRNGLKCMAALNSYDCGWPLKAAIFVAVVCKRRPA